MILGLLYEGPSHPYRLLKELNKIFSHVWSTSQSQLYLLLERLYSKGLVSYELISQGPRPPQKLFSITEDGKRSFENWLLTPTFQIRNMRVDFIPKVYFLLNLFPQAFVGLRDAQERVLTKIIDGLVQGSLQEEDRFKKIVLSSKVANARAWLDWLRGIEVT